MRAVEAKRAVWRFVVSNLLRDPEHIRTGMEHLVERDRTTRVGEPEREAEAWALKMPGTTGGGAMPTRH